MLPSILKSLSYLQTYCLNQASRQEQGKDIQFDITKKRIIRVSNFLLQYDFDQASTTWRIRYLHTNTNQINTRKKIIKEEQTFCLCSEEQYGMKSTQTDSNSCIETISQLRNYYVIMEQHIIINYQDMSRKKQSWEISGNLQSGEIKGKYEKEQPMFPYGCQWGCNRQNVVSAPGNSCGRPGCNQAWTKAKSWSHKMGWK